MGVIRRVWDSPLAWGVLRRTSVWIGFGVMAYRLALWVTHEDDPIWALFRLTVGVGLGLLVMALVWGLSGALLPGLEISRLYDPIKGDRTEWSENLQAAQPGRLIVEE